MDGVASWEQVAQWSSHPAVNRMRHTATVTDGPDGQLWSQVGAQLAAGMLADSSGTVSYDTVAGAVIGLAAATEIADAQGHSQAADQNAAAAHALVVFADSVIAEALLRHSDTADTSASRSD